MERVILAFESERNCRRIREVLDSSGAVQCTVCRSAAEVKRAALGWGAAAVVCGYKLPDATAEELLADLPRGSAMLILAREDQLELCAGAGALYLPAPAARGELLAGVEALLGRFRELERLSRPGRTGAEEAAIRAAKAALAARYQMPEEQSHRLLQRRSMDLRLPLAQAAEQVLKELKVHRDEG